MEKADTFLCVQPSIRYYRQTACLNPAIPAPTRSGRVREAFLDRPDLTFLAPPHLNLLIVCRQIYRETRLLPFSENTFCFTDFDAHDHLLAFLSYLQPFQRAAIRRVAMHCNGGRNKQLARLGVSHYTRHITSGLRGLRELDFTFTPYSWHHARALFGGVELPGDAVGTSRAAMDAQVLVFRGFRGLQRVTVTVTGWAARAARPARLPRPTHLQAMSSPDEGGYFAKHFGEKMREWEKGMTRMLMRPRSPLVTPLSTTRDDNAALLLKGRLARLAHNDH